MEILQTSWTLSLSHTLTGPFNNPHMGRFSSSNIQPSPPATRWTRPPPGIHFQQGADQVLRVPAGWGPLLAEEGEVALLNRLMMKGLEGVGRGWKGLEV